MVIAELRYEGHYSDFHDAIVECLIAEFPDLQHGHQGDSWIWIGEAPDKVEIDTFYSMMHQVKAADRQNPVLSRVLDRLQSCFTLEIFANPVKEPQED